MVSMNFPLKKKNYNYMYLITILHSLNQSKKYDTIIA